MKALASFIVCFLISGCTDFSYTRPTVSPYVPATRIVEKPLDEVWNSAISGLDNQSFRITAVDNRQREIQVNYRGDPESYIDCGKLISRVEQPYYKSTEEVSCSRSRQSYEIERFGNLLCIDNRLSMVGEVTLVFDEISPTQTGVTAVAHYSVTRYSNVRTPMYLLLQSETDTLSLWSGSTAAFPGHKARLYTECVATGKLERDILALIR